MPLEGHRGLEGSCPGGSGDGAETATDRSLTHGSSKWWSVGQRQACRRKSRQGVSVPPIAAFRPVAGAVLKRLLAGSWPAGHQTGRQWGGGRPVAKTAAGH